MLMKIFKRDLTRKKYEILLTNQLSTNLSILPTNIHISELATRDTFWPNPKRTLNTKQTFNLKKRSEIRFPGRTKKHTPTIIASGTNLKHRFFILNRFIQETNQFYSAYFYSTQFKQYKHYWFKTNTHSHNQETH